MQLVSADSHVIEPADLWETRVDRKYRDQAPKVRQRSDGKWTLTAPGGIEFPVSGHTAAGKVGTELREHLQQGYEVARPSGWDPVERIKDQQIDGVLAEVLYSSNGMPLFGLEDAELLSACFKAYNDWLAEYCSASPDRLLGIALISLRDIPGAVKELERSVKSGLRGAMISNGPSEPYHSSAYDPFWQAASELGTPLSVHIITASRKQSVSDFSKAGFTMLVDWLHDTQCALLSFLSGGVLERFPRLKLVSAENDIGWLPHFINRLDHQYEKRSSENPLPLKPSDYARRQIWATFQDDPAGVRLYDMFGEDNYMWASDFPHLDSTWPNSRKVIERNFDGVPPEVTQKIVCGNASALYRIGLG